ncbi:hypothetical protein DQ04_09791020 [Trypanosoma grayi]|uniref:hypothetical protein n=1 Tax=Trypanosoma grayi TaxID=71804 RepID=UPI0004F439DC|nr:hypothetical protein DQ04_09791020 [Trypanosoma grayi]KEG07442.1 hypothetical protein DQ04_09791020 [Trypanosoma grayi]
MVCRLGCLYSSCPFARCWGCNGGVAGEETSQLLREQAPLFLQLCHLVPQLRRLRLTPLHTAGLLRQQLVLALERLEDAFCHVIIAVAVAVVGAVCVVCLAATPLRNSNTRVPIVSCNLYHGAIFAAACHSPNAITHIAMAAASRTRRKRQRLLFPPNDSIQR